MSNIIISTLSINSRIENKINSFYYILYFQCEDDGVILSSLLYKADVNHVGLLVLNAKTFKELGRAEFHTPGPVPKCLHGWFLPQK